MTFAKLLTTMKRILILLLIICNFQAFTQPKISFSFDDGSVSDRPGYALEEWNQMLLDKLDQADVKAIFFVAGHNKTSEKGGRLLKSWDARGHKIANHTLTHPFFNSDKVSLEDLQRELLSNDSIIQQYENYTRLFRFPYLKEGNTPEKVIGFRQFLDAHGYSNGYVTIDASDWYIDSRLVKRLKEQPEGDIDDFKQFYLEHLWDRANYYEKLSYDLTGRHIHHTLLLHHNLAAALFIDDLIKMFQQRGWEITTPEKAYEDPIFKKIPKHAGESLIWAIAKDSGNYEDQLRYPAEDGKYEQEKMDERGL